MFHEDYGEMKLLESRKNNYYGSHGYVLQNSYVEIQPPTWWYLKVGSLRVIWSGGRCPPEWDWYPYKVMKGIRAHSLSAMWV